MVTRLAVHKQNQCCFVFLFVNIHKLQTLANSSSALSTQCTAQLGGRGRGFLTSNFLRGHFFAKHFLVHLSIVSAEKVNALWTKSYLQFFKYYKKVCGWRGTKLCHTVIYQRQIADTVQHYLVKTLAYSVGVITNGNFEWIAPCSYIIFCTTHKLTDAKFCSILINQNWRSRTM